MPGFADCTVKPCTKQLHLTLAHKFYPHHQRTLEQLARAVPPGHSCQWTAALYSRDMRFVHYQVSTRAGQAHWVLPQDLTHECPPLAKHLSQHPLLEAF